jgi:hypothetical protein
MKYLLVCYNTFEASGGFWRINVPRYAHFLYIIREGPLLYFFNSICTVYKRRAVCNYIANVEYVIIYNSIKLQCVWLYIYKYTENCVSLISFSIHSSGVSIHYTYCIFAYYTIIYYYTNTGTADSLINVYRGPPFEIDYNTIAQCGRTQVYTIHIMKYERMYELYS